MILHRKNAEMTIVILSFLHFYSVKSSNFCYFFLNIFFFLNLAVFYIGENKKSQKYFFFFLKCKNLGRRIRKQEMKKKMPNSFYSSGTCYGFDREQCQCSTYNLLHVNH